MSPADARRSPCHPCNRVQVEDDWLATSVRRVLGGLGVGSPIELDLTKPPPAAGAALMEHLGAALAETAAAEEERAAVTLQAAQRGRAARQEAAQLQAGRVIGRMLEQEEFD